MILQLFFKKNSLCTHINFDNDRQNRMSSTSELIEKVRRGGFIFISGSALVEYTIQDDCSLEQIGEVFNPNSCGLVFRPGAHFLIYSNNRRRHILFTILFYMRAEIL